VCGAFFKDNRLDPERVEPERVTVHILGNFDIAARAPAHGQLFRHPIARTLQLQRTEFRTKLMRKCGVRERNSRIAFILPLDLGVVPETISLQT
jgi:hypothetical protein